jgi:transcriptional regulator with XRE-family HTH domain
MSTADIRQQFGERIRSLRQARGWPQVEMEDFLAMDRSYFSEIETGKKDPSLTMLKTLATGLKITLSKLKDGL